MIDPDYVEQREREIRTFEARARGEIPHRHRSKRNAKGQFVAGWSEGPRVQAKAKGLKRYMGIPCIHGHSGERYTRTSDCCECRRLDFLKRRAANHEKYNEYARRYFHTTMSAEQKAKSFEKWRIARKLWEKENREAHLASKKKHWQNNREKWRVYIRNRRARLAGVPGTHDENDTIAIRAKQNDRCKHCNIELHGKGEFDHITPLSRGGSNWAHNLQLLCLPCNRRKHAKDPVVHARAIGLLPPIPTAASAADDAQP